MSCMSRVRETRSRNASGRLNPACSSRAIWARNRSADGQRHGAHHCGLCARDNRITQAIVGRSAVRGLRSYMYYLAIQKFMSEAPHVDLHIVTQEKR